jgi:hypothetical protein
MEVYGRVVVWLYAFLALAVDGMVSQLVVWLYAFLALAVDGMVSQLDDPAALL